MTNILLKGPTYPFTAELCPKSESHTWSTEEWAMKMQIRMTLLAQMNSVLLSLSGVTAVGIH